MLQVWQIGGVGVDRIRHQQTHTTALSHATKCRLWNIAEGTCTATLRGHIKAVTRVAVFGNTAASSSEENNMVK